MKCPQCKTKRSARKEYAFPDLLDHMMGSHPEAMLSMAREVLKSQATAFTDEIFVRAPDAT